jgi:hypothetical protein
MYGVHGGREGRWWDYFSKSTDFFMGCGSLLKNKDIIWHGQISNFLD